MADIDPNSPIPIYHQLKHLVRERIECGLWRPGDRIPTERELCQTYDISRSPVRQALNELAYEGVLIRRPGLGTFVNDSASTGPGRDEPFQMMCSDASWSKVLVRVAYMWNAEHPGRSISFQVNVVNHSQFHSLLRVAIGSGAAPDVAMVDCVWVAGLAQSGFLYALEDLDAQWNYTGFGKDLYPVFVEANSFEGRLYGLPVKADASLLWYRKDWFAQEGLEPPQDWDDLLDITEHFLRPGVKERYGLVYPLAFPGGTAAGEATVYSLMPFIWSAGGEVFEAEFVVLDAPGTRRALRFLRELVTLHRASPPEVVDYREDTTPRLFASGKLAMALGGSSQGDILRVVSDWGDAEFAERVGCAVPPAAPGRRPALTVGGTSYVILRQCQRARLVMDVLKMATDPEVVGDLYRSMLQSWASPAFNALLASDVEPMLTWTSRVIAAGRTRPSIPEYVKVSRQLQAMFEAALSHAAPVDEIVRRAAESIAAICERPCREV